MHVTKERIERGAAAVKSTARLVLASPVLLALLLASAVVPLSAFEAHIINVTATIERRPCVVYETRSMGFWMNHEDLWILPQNLGDLQILNADDARNIFDQADTSMTRKLQAQLLALKFSLAYFESGEGLVPGETTTASELAEEADALLSQTWPKPTKKELEAMKDRVESVNVAEQIFSRDCEPPPPPPPPEDCECLGKVSALTLRYNGAETVQVKVVQKQGELVAFEGEVDPGEEFSFVGKDDKGTLGTEIIIYIDDTEHTRIHTSCSQPIGPGLVSGDFEVVEGQSREGGLLCPLVGEGEVLEATFEVQSLEAPAEAPADEPPPAEDLPADEAGTPPEEEIVPSPEEEVTPPPAEEPQEEEVTLPEEVTPPPAEEPAPPPDTTEALPADEAGTPPAE